MQAIHATIIHGPVVSIDGHLPSTASALLARAGAFNDMGTWKCMPSDWPRVEIALRGLGVPMHVIGEPAAGTQVLPLVYAPVRQKEATMSMDIGRIRIQGDLPQPVEKHWLGSEQVRGHVGMSPWAIEDFLAACKTQSINVALEPDVQRLRETLQRRRQAVDAALAGHDLPDVPLPAPYKLRAYQRQAIAFGEACGGRFFVADPVGGGKTAEAIGWKRYTDAQKIVVICPSVAKGNWRDEIRQKFDDPDVPVIILDGYANNGPRLPAKGYVITGYDTLLDKSIKERTHQGWLQYLKEWKPDLVICDESHRAKSHNSERGNAMRAIARSVRDFIPMTGTDQDKSSMDLWSQLDATEPGYWGTWFEFGLAFAAGSKKRRWYGKRYHEYYDMTGSSNAKILHDRMRYVRLKRDRSEIQGELPPQTRVRYPMDLLPEHRAEYDTVLAQYRAFVRGEIVKDENSDEEEPDQQKDRFVSSHGKRMGFILKLRQISSMGRIEGTVDLVDDLAEQGKKPVVFAYFTPVLHALRDGIKAKGYRVGFIDGSVSRPQRDAIRKEFTDGKLDVLVGQTEAMGIAINLQDVSDTTVTHELTYKILDIEQTEGRVYRSGQTKPTFHYYCMGDNTRDQSTLDVLLRKLASKEAVDRGVEEDLLKEIEADFFR